MVTAFVERLFFAAAWGSAALAAGVFLFMAYLAWPVLSHQGLLSVLTSPWSPATGQYGVYPMIVGSLSISFLALVLSLPLALGCAFFIHGLGPAALRCALLVVVRFMTGIPTVVYAFVSLFLLVPFMREVLTGGSGLSILTAACVLALLVSPTLILFFVDALRRVPRNQLLAVTALGGSRTQSLLTVALPQAWPGMLGGMLLGLGRAMGDTLVSLMLAGNAASVPHGLGDPARTLTAHIALVFAADFTSLEFRSIFACGLLLYLFTLGLVAVLRSSAHLARPVGTA